MFKFQYKIVSFSFGRNLVFYYWIPKNIVTYVQIVQIKYRNNSDCHLYIYCHTKARNAWLPQLHYNKCCSKLKMMHAHISLTVNHWNASKHQRFKITNVCCNEVCITIYLLFDNVKTCFSKTSVKIQTFSPIPRPRPLSLSSRSLETKTQSLNTTSISVRHETRFIQRRLPGVLLGYY